MIGKNIQNKINNTNWDAFTEKMHAKGFALLPGFLNNSQCEELKNGYSDPSFYRKTVVMERYRFGQGEYKYFDYPLPDVLDEIRSLIYPKLAPIANAWFKVLNIDKNFPPTHEELLQQCKENNQKKLQF